MTRLAAFALLLAGCSAEIKVHPECDFRAWKGSFERRLGDEWLHECIEDHQKALPEMRPIVLERCRAIAESLKGCTK